MKTSAAPKFLGAPKQLKVLIVEDSEIDAGLMVHELERFGYAVSWQRVYRAEALKHALKSQAWDLVLSDYAMPHFTGLEALEILQASGIDLPFLLVSGTIGEEVAVEAMRAGANDYLLKDRMARLGPAVERELREAEGRRARKRAEAALRASEERLRLAWETIPDALSISRLGDGTYVDVNQGWTSLTGHTRHEVIGKSSLDLGLWNDPEDRQMLVRGLIQHGLVKNLQTKIRRKDGDIRTVLISAGMMYLEGEPHLLGAIKDIEELKQAQQALAQSEELFRKYFELGLVGMALARPDKGWGLVNDRICQILGYTREELLQTTWPELTHPDDVEADLERFGRMLAGEIDGYSMEKRFIRKDGSTVYTMLHLTCMRSADGTVEHVIAHLHDITDQKEAQQLLQRHTHELETINRLGREISSRLTLEDVARFGLRELLSALKGDCAMLFVCKENDLVLRGFESSSPQASDRHFPVQRVGECLCGLSVEERKPVFSPDINDDQRCVWDGCRSAGLKSVAAVPLVAGEEIIGVIGLGSFQERDFSVEENFILSLGHEITLGLKNSLLFQEIQKHAAELEERLSELKRANEEKDNLQSQLLQAQKMEAVGILSGGIAHDFNNLLQVIEGYSDLGLFQIKAGQKGYRQLREIKKAARRAAELTEGLLTFSRRIESKLRPLNVNQEVQQVAGMLSRTIPKMIDIQIGLEEDVLTINGDPSQLQQVIMNLALNARDAMPEGGTLTIRTQNLELDAEYCRKHLGTKAGNHVVISISDTGSGMDEITRERIFDPFFTTKEVGKGTGLGLSIAYGIIKSHGGHIVCDSRRGEGTTFTIYFPAIAEETLSSPDIPEPEIPQSGTETMLIVDDEDMIREVAAKVFRNFGYKVLVAGDGKEGLQVYQERSDEIDLVILDLIMPEMDGKQCLEHILKINPSAKVLVASGYSADGHLEDIRKAGAVASISKPYTARRLLGLVRKLLDS